MTPQLPRIADTLSPDAAIKRWVAEHFGNWHPWEWVDETNLHFRLVGRKTVYLLRREGKWIVVYRVD